MNNEITNSLRTAIASLRSKIEQPTDRRDGSLDRDIDNYLRERQVKDASTAAIFTDTNISREQTPLMGMETLMPQELFKDDNIDQVRVSAEDISDPVRLREQIMELKSEIQSFHSQQREQGRSPSIYETVPPQSQQLSYSKIEPLPAWSLSQEGTVASNVVTNNNIDPVALQQLERQLWSLRSSSTAIDSTLLQNIEQQILSLKGSQNAGYMKTAAPRQQMSGNPTATSLDQPVDVDSELVQKLNKQISALRTSSNHNNPGTGTLSYQRTASPSIDPARGWESSVVPQQRGVRSTSGHLLNNTSVDYHSNGGRVYYSQGEVCHHQMPTPRQDIDTTLLGSLQQRVLSQPPTLTPGMVLPFNNHVATDLGGIRKSKPPSVRLRKGDNRSVSPQQLRSGAVGVNVLQLTSCIAGRLLEVAARLEWNTTKLSQIAEYVVAKRIHSATLRYKTELRQLMSREETNLLLKLNFCGEKVSVFTYGHFMLRRTWTDELGVDVSPKDVMVAELQDHSLEFSHQVIVDEFGKLKVGTRDGLPTLRKNCGKSVFGVRYSLPPQFLIFAASCVPGWNMSKVDILNSSYVKETSYTFTSQRRVHNLSPSSLYVDSMIEGALSAGLPDNYISYLHDLKSMKVVKKSIKQRHQSLVLDTALSDS